LIRCAEDIAAALEGLKGRVQALYTTGDPLMNAQRLPINTFALAARLPTMFSQRQYLEVGGLMPYGPNFLDLNRRSGRLVQ
jgi:putative ABC transport system substrate-binding protein